MKSMCCFAALTALAAGTAVGQISYMGDANLQGTGFGTTLPLLVLQATPEEFGSVLRMGGADVLTGDATGQSQTQPVSALTAMGIDAGNLGVIFNVAEPGSETNLTLQGFTVRFSDDFGNVLFDEVFSQTQVLEQVAGGVGGSGHLYSITLTPAEQILFFGSPTNRIGLFVNSPILNTAGAPDGFYLIPTPGAGGLLAGTMLLWARRRRAH